MPACVSAQVSPSLGAVGKTVYLVYRHSSCGDLVSVWTCFHVWTHENFPPFLELDINLQFWL